MQMLMKVQDQTEEAYFMIRNGSNKVIKSKNKKITKCRHKLNSWENKFVF